MALSIGGKQALKHMGWHFKIQQKASAGLRTAFVQRYWLCVMYCVSCIVLCNA